ncbi:hypothetical protein PVAND_011083 [Polypedilum vanderplanki]|uniref:Uncharacterized protein n=1 Tax=Polypedilum vanderplanki TaxID=319348 RepID=A0A9J6CI87_POLVA|nr:hypothetical protein PVAND_011083 [Polypedilum vanderplanki]
MNFYLLILSYYNSTSRKRKITRAEMSHYNSAYQRFVLYVILFSFMGTCWQAEFKTYKVWNSDKSTILAGVLACFTAAFSSYLLLFSPLVYSQLFGKNNALKNGKIENDSNEKVQDIVAGNQI